MRTRKFFNTNFQSNKRVKLNSDMDMDIDLVPKASILFAKFILVSI
jgi:hypothetical protein